MVKAVELKRDCRRTDRSGDGRSREQTRPTAGREGRTMSGKLSAGAKGNDLQRKVEVLNKIFVAKFKSKTVELQSLKVTAYFG